MKKGEQSLGFIVQKRRELELITSFLFSFKMNSSPARVCPSLVVSVGLTDLPSPLLSLFSHLHGEVTAGRVCLETLLLLEGEVLEEGRGESLAAWACAFLLGEAGAGSGNKCPRSLRHGVGCFGTGYFPWEGCWESWGVGGAGRSCWENGSAEILLSCFSWVNC